MLPVIDPPVTLSEASKILSKKHKCACNMCAAAYILKHSMTEGMSQEVIEKYKALAAKKRGGK